MYGLEEISLFRSFQLVFFYFPEMNLFLLTQHLQDSLLGSRVVISASVPRHQRLSPPGGRHKLPTHHGVHEDQRQQGHQEEDDRGELVQVERRLKQRTKS